MEAEKKKPVERAREAVAARYAHGYHKRAILAGEWDSGSLVRNELERIRNEEGQMIDGK